MTLKIKVTQRGKSKNLVLFYFLHTNKPNFISTIVLALFDREFALAVQRITDESTMQSLDNAAFPDKIV